MNLIFQKLRKGISGEIIYFHFEHIIAAQN